MSGITFSMNGFRKNMASDINELRASLESAMDEIPDWIAEDIKDNFDRVACASNGLNCVSIKDDPYFIDMTDEPCIRLFSEDED